MPELSAFILTYNEGPSIGGVVEKVLGVLRRLDAAAEVVVVDGGSKDGTQENARAAGAIVYQQKAPGYGAAFREGLGYIRSEYVVTLDADLSHDPEIIPKLWELRHQAELVIASRYTRGGKADLTPFRRFLSWFLNGVYRRVLDMPVADMSSGFRLYRTDALAGIKLVSPKFDVLEEILIKIYNRGWRVLEMPFHYTPRLHGESHLRVVSFGMAYGRTLLRLMKIRHQVQAADYDVRARRSIDWRRRLWAWRRAVCVRQLLAGHEPTLDLGGTAAALGMAGAGMVVADTSPERLRPLRHHGGTRLLLAPQHLPFADGAFGSVVCSADSFTAAAALAEIRRVLQPGGLLVVFAERVSPGVWDRLLAAGFTVEVVPCPPGAAMLSGTIPEGVGVKSSPEPVCPSCARPLAGADCPGCGLQWPSRDGIADLSSAASV